ncbi:hypothetical protein [Halobellus rufus]|uniref:hypothetical protein n=1 Tax=Halobellus rufus TaxID=1448860 RepID=UPI000679B652|nr:hypothetical protein [Halobellus rufus]
MTLGDPAKSVAESVDGDRASALLDSVRNHELPPVLHDLVSEYQSFEGARPWFIWRWVHHLAPKNTMPVVDGDHREAVATNKTMLVLFITILDDLAEKQRDYRTFDAITRFVRLGADDCLGRTDRYSDGGVHENGSDSDRLRDATADDAYVAFARSVWETLLERLRRSPSFERYAPLFRFDVGQIVTAIEYSTLAIDRPDLVTPSDLRRYEAHNMGMYSYLDIDLMYTRADHTDELSEFRAVVDPAQRMARIGNWLSTWERELREGDVSSAVVVSARERGLVDAEPLSHLGDIADDDRVEAAIDRIRAADVETELLEEWNEEYDRLVAAADRVDSIDLTPFAEGTKDVLRYHLASRGFK